MSLSIEERVKLAVWYEWSRSVVDVQRRYRQQFGRTPPSKDTIHKWHTRLMETGSVCDAQRDRQSSSEGQAAVRKHFEAQPMSSQRQAVKALNVSRGFIQKALKDYGFHPYKLQVLHQLSPEDFAQRVSFASDELERIESDPSRLYRIAFSDESHFSVDGVVNRHNCRYWSAARPTWTQQQPLHSARTTVWAAIWAGGCIGPFFFDDSVTGDSYLAMLETFFWPQVIQLGLSTDLVFMQDGAPPHWKKEVRQWLDQHFPHRWMGRASPNMPWPPRSPDLTPCDFSSGAL